MTLIAGFLILGLLIFWGISLINVLKHRGINVNVAAETPESMGFAMALTGSLLLFAETLALIAVELTTRPRLVFGVFQITGLIFFLMGCILHSWSVYTRGYYATSWSMREKHELIVDPPYNLVRHPSYLGYILMIIGISLIWQRWFTFLPFIAIPGYVMVSKHEEELLLKRFGDAYRRYIDRVGAFIPKK